MNVTVSDLDKLEEQIRSNQAPTLEDLVARIKPQELPRPMVARYANLLKRMGETKYALKVLNPIVRNKLSKPTITEIVEYASCLTHCNLEDESIALLEEVKDEPNPEIQFELAVAHISKWEYPNVIPYLKKYLAFPGLSPYRVCVGEINLGASYIYTNQLQEAEQTLQKLLVKIQAGNFNLLWGNTLELLAEIALMKRDFTSAERYIQEASAKLLAADPRYKLYIDKWNVIGKMLKENGSEESLAECARVRKEAAQLMNWNTLREIELFRAVVTEDTKAIINLYHGVPYLEFRKRILSIWGKPLSVADFYERQIGPGVAEEKNLFDVAKGRDSLSGAQLKVGQTLYRLMQSLTTDFYAPFSVPKIFALVFKGSVFNPDSSSQQVYEIIKRLNTWFQKNKIPLTVDFGEGGYRLRAKEAYILRIQSRFTLRTKLDDFFDNLKQHGLVEAFSAKAVSEKLELAPRTVRRLLSEGVASRKLLRQGNAKSTTYSFAKKLKFENT